MLLLLDNKLPTTEQAEPLAGIRPQPAVELSSFRRADAPTSSCKKPQIAAGLPWLVQF
jgi:hypothetical protein